MMGLIVASIAVGVILSSGVFYLSMRRECPTHYEPLDCFEKDAEEILRRSGFDILSRRKKANIITNVNGKDHFGFVEVDYIVRKKKKKYAVAVKAGEGTADANEPVLRRRLIEYEHILALDGLLILDLSRGEINRVTFRFPKDGWLDKFFKIFTVLLAILGVIGIIWMLASIKLI
ncbi:MAG: hypothetical protein U9R38_00920 [Candidatus Margulisiibacteriota bacterium]|nr:hypothetical protein [Candidatus Margulisiibacteriota bacterium]